MHILQLTRHYFNIIIEDTVPIYLNLALLQPKNAKGFILYSFKNNGNDFELCNEILNVDFATGRVSIAKYLYKLNEQLTLNCSILMQTSFAYGEESIFAHFSLKVFFLLNFIKILKKF